MNILLQIINRISRNSNNKMFEELNDEMDLRSDLGFNSLDLAELTVRIEQEFGVDIFENQLVFTIGEIKKILDEQAS